jgi:hypothetical protein
MTCGSGGIGNASIATLLKDLRQRLKDDANPDWKLDERNYTLESVTSRVHQFFSEKAKESDFKYFFCFEFAVTLSDARFQKCGK